MSRIINRVRGIRGSFRPGQVITTPTGGTRGPAQLSDINTLASQLTAAGVGGAPAAGNGVPSGGTDGQVLAKVAGAVAWSFTTAITAVGTIATGIWQGTKIALAYGGTNADLSATGPGFLKQATTGANVTVAALAESDLPNSGVTAGSYTLTSLTVNAQGFITAASSGSAGGTGTVTSVAMTVPAEFSVSGSPITTSGTLAVTWANEADDTILSRIAGTSGVPSFNSVAAILDHHFGTTDGTYSLQRLSGAWTVTAASSSSATSDWDGPINGGFGCGAFGSGSFGGITVMGDPLTESPLVETGSSGQFWASRGPGTTPAWRQTLTLTHGGTSADLSATGGTSQVLKQSSAGAAITVGQLAASDLSNGTTGTGAVVLANAPTFTGAPTAPGFVSNALPTSAPAVDASTTTTISSGSNIALPASSGLVIVNVTLTGDSGCYLLGGGVVIFLGGTIGTWVAATTTPAAGKASVQFDGAGHYKVYNNTGSTVTFSCAFLACRDAV